MQWSDAATDCTAAVAADDKYVKAYLRRATAYEEADDLERSLADYKKASAVLSSCVAWYCGDILSSELPQYCKRFAFYLLVLSQVLGY